MPTKGKRMEESHVDELVSAFGFLSVNATPRDFDGLAQEGFAQLILAPSTVVDLLKSSADVLPSRPSITSLVQFYIEHDRVFYPFLSAAKIFGSVEALYEGHATPSDEWIVFLVIAISRASLSASPEEGSYLEADLYRPFKGNTFLGCLEGGHPTIELMRLRKTVSVAYQSLFLVGPDVLLDPRSTICDAHLALANWDEELGQIQVQEASKLSFRSEIWYSQILLLSPICLMQALESYVNDLLNIPSCTSHDLFRTIFVADRFAKVHTIHEDDCFDDSLPPRPMISPSTRLLPLLDRNRHERLCMALESLCMLNDVTHLLGEKYGVSNTWTDAIAALDKAHAALRTRLA
ncbi:MAG: hypothetical protein Q9166_000458 [cf. Caloplaca sp. 2 TL-2023]